MENRVGSAAGPERRPSVTSSDWIDPRTVETDYGIRRGTQAIWPSANRYGFGELARKAGARVLYRRSAIEAWLNSRTLDVAA